MHIHEEDAGLHREDVVAGHGEDVINEEQDGGHGEDDGTQQSDSFVLNSVMQDPHVRELLRNNTTSERAASREEAKLAQLELDSKTPLYEGCRPEDTRLSFMLGLLKTKAKNKWSDTSLDEHLNFLQETYPKGNMCPTSIEEAKKIVCPLDLPHVRYHACINDFIIYRN